MASCDLANALHLTLSRESKEIMEGNKLSGLRSYRSEDNPEYRKFFPDSARGPIRRMETQSSENVGQPKPMDAPVANEI